MVRGYMVSLTDKDSAIPNLIRPNKIITNANHPNESILTGLYHNGQNQFLGEIDCYRCSHTYLYALRREIIAEHGLFGLTDDRIDDYLDENGLSIPEPNRFTLPTFQKNDKVRVEIRGKPCQVMLVGVTYE